MEDLDSTPAWFLTEARALLVASDNDGQHFRELVRVRLDNDVAFKNAFLEWSYPTALQQLMHAVRRSMNREAVVLAREVGQPLVTIADAMVRKTSKIDAVKRVAKVILDTWAMPLGGFIGDQTMETLQQNIKHLDTKVGGLNRHIRFIQTVRDAMQQADATAATRVRDAVSEEQARTLLEQAEREGEGEGEEEASA